MTKLFIVLFLLISLAFAQEKSTGLLQDFPEEVYAGEVVSFSLGEYLPNSVLELIGVTIEYIPEVDSDFVPASYELFSTQYNNKQWHISFKTEYPGTWQWVVVASHKGKNFWFYKHFKVLQ